MEAAIIIKMECKDGNHIGVNNTTGKCPGCGEQIECQTTYGFAQALSAKDETIKIKTSEKKL